MEYDRGISHYKKQLNKLYAPASLYSGRARLLHLYAYETIAGEPVGSFYGYVTDGIYRSEEELAKGRPGIGIGVQGLWLGDIGIKILTVMADHSCRSNIYR